MAPVISPRSYISLHYPMSIFGTLFIDAKSICIIYVG